MFYFLTRPPPFFPPRFLAFSVCEMGWQEGATPNVCDAPTCTPACGADSFCSYDCLTLCLRCDTVLVIFALRLTDRLVWLLTPPPLFPSLLRVVQGAGYVRVPQGLWRPVL